MPALDDALARSGAVLVEDRVLRRIIKHDRKIRGIGLQVPHATCYPLRRDVLGRLADRRELAIDVAALPERVIAVRGSRDALSAGDAEALSRVWRATFHGRIHEAFDDQLARGELTAAVIRERIHRIGQTEFDEIRFVLRQEELLLPPVDDASTYIELAAVYLELARFSPRTLDRMFPTLRGADHVEATIALDVDAAALLAASRPAGAPERPIVELAVVPEQAAPRLRPTVPSDPSAKLAAAAARAKGNRSRAAILSARAGDLDAARADLDELAARLSRALHGADPTGWAEALLPVARWAAGQRVIRFTAGARLLYDLQAACVVAEREVKVVDVASWALSLGRRPIVRPLPATREVRVAKHLHAAAKKIAEAGLESGDDRERLAGAIHDMVERADHAVRTMMRPKIEAALDTVALRPRHLPERVAQKKIVDELLDQAVSVGRLSLGNLRDALSHNDLKMPDLRPGQLATGDQLLRCDRELSHSLDGVYRPGEIYLRLLQKISSVLFGTALGRVLSLYVVLPVLGSFVLLEGIQHVVGPVLHHTVGWHPRIATTPAFAGVAGFIFLLLHAPPFRRGVVVVLRAVGRGLYAAFVAAPRAVWRLPIVRRIRDSRFARWVLRPAIPTAIAALAGSWQIAAGVFVAAELVSNSRPGQVVEEVVADWLVRSSRQVLRRIIPNLVKYLLELFVELVELLDRAIYRVDEWLRFKTGQSWVTLVVKGALGTLWFFVAYFLRAYVNLFLEPVFNPIKHFPVVTVAAKLTLPFSPSMIRAIRGALEDVVGPTVAGSFAAFTVFVIPGLAGFLVWEFKENWKLYARSRPETLRAIAIGHHGETIPSFLLPGFHSGTIPKLFTKLRRATWKGDERGIAKHKEGLHHVEDAIWKFADRELVSMLNEAGPFRATDVAVSGVELGSNRVVIELVCPSVAAEPVAIAFEQQSGWIVASVHATGWIDRLDGEQRRIFEIALAGFYKLSGVDVVRQQLERALGGASYDISDEGLVMWPGRDYDTEVVYDLKARIPTTIVRGAAWDGRPPILDGSALYGRAPLRWSEWTAVWEQLAEAGGATRIVVGTSLLPDAQSSSRNPLASSPSRFKAS